MYQLQQFSDSSNFTIINSVPYFNNPGNSYLDKLKNRISLEYYCLMNQETIEVQKEVEEVELEEVQINLSDKYDILESEIPIINCRKRKERKGNKNISKDRFIEKEKRIGKKNIKKNVRQKGYSNKLFITQQLPREDEEDEDCEIWDEEFYLMYNGYYHSNQDLWGGDGGFYFDSYY
jgi:hypothetical protein